MGPCLSLPIRNETKYVLRDIKYLKPGEKEDYVFDYELKDWGEGLPVINNILKTRMNFEFGTIIEMSKFKIEFGYSCALFKTSGVVGLNFQDKFDTY